MRFSVYLAGPITGIEAKNAIGWRTKVKRVLHDWTIYDPTDVECQIDNKFPTGNEPGVRPLAFTATGICAKDELYIRKSDIILANFTYDSGKGSLGTAWELGAAWEMRKTIISVIPKGSVHDHPFMRRRSHVFVETLDEALDYLKML